MLPFAPATAGEAGAGDALAGQLAYWRRQLAGATAALDLPADFPPPPARTGRTARRALILPEATAARLREVARQEGAAPFVLLLAAFAALLARYSGQDDLLIGTPAANRTRPQAEGGIGGCENTLALRARFSGELDFRRLSAAMRDTAAGAFAHQELPFETLAAALREAGEAAGLTPPRVMLAPRAGRAAPAGVDLVLVAAEREEAATVTLLELDLEYASDLFTAATATRLLRHFEALLAAALGDPACPVSRLQLLSPEERHQLCVEWNDTRSAYPRRSLHRLFEEQAAAQPAAVAVTWDGGELTYGELDRRANRIARRLRLLRVGREALVGLCVDRSGGDMVAAMLGILKAGGAYVPLDPSLPRQRLASLLEDAAPAALVGPRRFLAALPPAAPPLILETLDETAAGAETGADQGADPAAAGGQEVAPAELAYVLFTSGSTGPPKGVEVTHQAVVRLVRETGYAAFGRDEVFLQLAPLSFDAATLEIWGPLLNGGRLALFPARPFSLAQLSETVERHGVTTLWLTAGLFHLAVDDGLHGLRGLRQLLAGGDVLSREHVERAQSALPGTALINGYGPTENTTFSCCFRVPPGFGGGDPGAVPIGRAIAGSRAYVLDQAGEPAPVGCLGELYVGGAGLARGYRRRPELTAERFVPDPFGGAGRRLYRTGDLVRRRGDGALEFHGRRDLQVKVRGHRIELEEVEGVLLRHPGVRETACLALAGGDRDQRLVACFVAAGQDVESAGLRTFLRQRLPEPMVPSSFVPLAALPLTPEGKVDRHALAALVRAAEAAPGGRSPALDGARGPLAETLAGIWTEILPAAAAGDESNFFELGGHSLLAARLVSRVRQRLGVELPLAAVFEEPTLGAQVRLVEGLLLQGEAGAALTAAPALADAGLPLSFGQERLWLGDRLMPGSPVYNVPLVMRLAGRLPPGGTPALAAALSEIVRRHEVLRTVFTMAGDEPAAVVRPAGALALPVFDLSRLEPSRRLAATAPALSAAARRPFDLEGGPLLRTLLVRRGDADHDLLVNIHHIAFDGWSMGVLADELGTLYRAAVKGDPSPLPELPIQHGDYALWQRRWLDGAALEPHLAAWRQRLAGHAPALDLPTDRPRPPVMTHRGASAVLALPIELARGLGALSRQLRVTMFMTFAAGFAALLHRYTGQPDLLLGVPVANRSQSKIHKLIGFFVNTIVLRCDLAGDPDFHRLLGRVREAALHAMAHQELPFEKLVEDLAPERDPARTPLFQVLLAYQNVPRPPLDLGPGIAATIEPQPTGTAKFDLSLAVEEATAGGISGKLDYSTDLFDAATVLRLAGHLETLLAAAVAEPGLPISELTLLTAAERAQLAEWRAEGLDPAPPPAACLHHLVERQAARTPGAPALVCGLARLTYAELDERADRLARRLRALGVGPETAVGLCLERSASLVVAMLAILKAGGFYVPLDPAYPAERMAFIVADSGARVLVSESRLAARLGPAAPRLLLLDASEPRHGGAATAMGPPAIDPDNLAYVVYTSGSTGRPKAVAIAHRSAVGLAAWARQVFTAEELAGVLASTSIAFDLSVFEIFVPLAWGGTVILADHALALPDLPAAAAVTLINTVPSVMAELLGEGSPPASLRTVNLAGEPLSRALAERILAWHGGLRLYNLYGPSEDTTYSTCARADLASPHAPPIGRAITGSWTVLLDRRSMPVPIGVAGELCLGGGGLARGYLGRPELTAERWVPDPGAGAPGERLYRTGDLARLLADGSLDFLGRLDHQVKVRGFRIELGEIEAALAACPGVAAAAVLVAEAGAERRLVAYVAPATLSAAALRGALRERLPDYMLPASWVFLDALPLTPTGKVDRRALPAGAPAPPDLEPAFVAPRSPLEQALSEVWAEVLRRPRVGVDDNFFALGGDSIRAIQVAARCRRLDLEIAPHDIFREPTVAALAAAIAAIADRLAATAGELEGPARRPAATLAEVAAPAFAPPASGSSPADFPLAGLDQEELDELFAELA